MSTMNMFEYATRQGLRFPSQKGLVSVEDLWRFSLEELDVVAKVLNQQVKDDGEESFITTTSVTSKPLLAKFEIVKYIIGVKLEAKASSAKAADKKAEKEKLMSILATKKDDELQGKSAEEIEEMISDLG